MSYITRYFYVQCKSLQAKNIFFFFQTPYVIDKVNLGFDIEYFDIEYILDFIHFHKCFY